MSTTLLDTFQEHLDRVVRLKKEFIEQRTGRHHLANGNQKGSYSKPTLIEKKFTTLAREVSYVLEDLFEWVEVSLALFFKTYSL